MTTNSVKTVNISTTFLRAFSSEIGVVKLAKITTLLQPHQERVVSRISREDQPGLVVAHGLGSGKTLTSIAAIDALGGTSAVLVPASLANNYRKELAKHTDGSPNPAVLSLQRAALHGKSPDSDVLVVDEAHRIRETKTKAHRAIRSNKAKKRLLLTASPLYNRPSDIAPLVNIVAGYNVLPNDPAEFNKRYIKDKKISPGLWGRLKGIKPGSIPVLNPKEKKWLTGELGRWVDYHAGSKEGFPDVTYEDVKVPISREQRKIYDALINKAPPWMRHKVRKGMPPSKQESKQLNAFMTALRQVSLSTAPFITKGESSEAKVEAAFQNAKKTLSNDKDSKVVVYSNYLEAGLGPYKKRLDAEGIPYGEFSGKTSKKDRDQAIIDYNKGEIRTLLLSSAGGEGLDLSGTSVIQVLEPHWNREKVRQVEGRAIRYGSHDHLPKEKRNVVVQRYLGTIPRTKILEKMRLRDPGSGADEYLSLLSSKKDELNQQFRDLLTGIDKESSEPLRVRVSSGSMMNHFLNGFTDELVKVGGSPGMVFKENEVPSYKPQSQEMVFKKENVPSYGSKQKAVKPPKPATGGLTSEQQRVIGRRDALFAKLDKPKPPTQAGILKKRDALFSKIREDKLLKKRDALFEMRRKLKQSKTVAGN